MSIHGGSPKTDGYQEEHAAGLLGCTTGNSYHYSKNDSYYAYTDFESIDVTIANHYEATPATAKLPFSSLHIGAGAHSDADSVGLGQRYISWRARQAGDAQYGNAIEPIQDAGQVYDMLMERVNLLCSGSSNQPATDTTKVRAALARKKSLIDFRLGDIAEAKRCWAWTRRTPTSWTVWSTAGARSRRPTPRRSPAWAAGTSGGRRQHRGLSDGRASDGQRHQEAELRRSVAHPRSDDRPRQAGLRVGPDAGRGLHAVGRVQRPVDAQPQRHQGAPHAGAQQRRQRPVHHGQRSTPRSSRACWPR